MPSDPLVRRVRMPHLAAAAADQIEAIYAESHALWGAGLSLRDYRGLWSEINATPWAVRHARFQVWIGEVGEVLSSMKLYHPLVRAGGVTSRCSVYGAIFTPRARRGSGHATEMLRHAIRRSRERGERLVLLYSDIGTDYYSAFGFRALPAEEQWGRIPRDPGPVPAGWRVRPATAEDLPAVYEAHEDTCRGRPLAMVRDPAHWDFLRVRVRAFFERLRDSGIRSGMRVVTAGDRFAGYLIAVEGRGEWNIREVGSARGDVEIMAGIVRTVAHEARLAGQRRFYGWLPRNLIARLGNWTIHSRPRRRAIPMILPLDPGLDLRALDSPEGAYIPYQDQF